MLRPAVARLTGTLALAGLACAPVVQAQRLPGFAEQREPLRRIAVAPFYPSLRLARSEDLGDTTPALAAALVARHFSDGLVQRVGMIPADDVRRALGLEERPAGALPPAELARLARRAAEEFGADALVVGELSRFVERAGEAAGTLRPASVSFTVTLYAAPSARALWRARFDETQRALSENVFNAARYPGAGSRWLSADELAQWGAGEVALALPLVP